MIWENAKCSSSSTIPPKRDMKPQGKKPEEIWPEASCLLVASQAARSRSCRMYAASPFFFFIFFIFLFLISLPFLLDRLIDYLFLSFYLALLRIQFSPQLESQSGFPSCRLATRVVDVVIFLQSINQTIALSSVTGHNILSNLSRHGCICVDNASRPT